MMSSNHLRIGEAAAILGICRRTLRRWEREGWLYPAYRTPGGHRRYERRALFTFIKTRSHHQQKKITRNSNKQAGLRAATYGRVSSSRQKTSGDLSRQMESLYRYCHQQGYAVTCTYSDVGSGLNDQRRGLLHLLRGAASRKFDVVVVNYTDRLGRFGLQVIREHFASWSVRLEVIHPTVLESSPHAELITDLTAILYSFMGKLYRLRRVN